MNWMKGFALVGVLALPLTATTWVGASAETATATDTKSSTASDKSVKAEAATTKKPTKDQMSAYQTKCTAEADAKGLFVKKGKGDERKKFRSDCIKKLAGE